ncbi:hypothetical protein J6590_061683 [Homalodisca vitripennis]|nr:hypothetical protein J6590_061683 [Homalodisca vitripennis]
MQQFTYSVSFSTVKIRECSCIGHNSSVRRLTLNCSLVTVYYLTEQAETRRTDVTSGLPQATRRGHVILEHRRGSPLRPLKVTPVVGGRMSALLLVYSQAARQEAD